MCFAIVCKVLTGVGNKLTFLHITGICVLQKNRCMHCPRPKRY